MRCSPRRVSLGCLAAAVALGGLLGVAATASDPPRAELPADERQEIGAGYAAVWERIDALGASAATDLADLPEEIEGSEPGVVFRHLERRLSLSGDDVHTLLVIDRNGTAVAWAGHGLLHRIESAPLPVSGRGFRTGFSAVTLFAVRPLSSGNQPWLLVAGRSFDRRQLPFGAAERTQELRWGLVDAEDEIAADQLAFPLERSPTLVVPRYPEQLEAASPSSGGSLSRLLAVVAALALLGWAGLRRVVRSEESSAPWSRAALWLAICGAAGAVAARWWPALEVDTGSALVGETGLVGAAIATAGLAWLVFRSPLRPRTGWPAAAVAGASSCLAVWLVGVGVDAGWRLPFADAIVFLPLPTFIWRAVLAGGFAVVMGAFAAQTARRDERRAWLAMALLLAAALLASRPQLALAPLGFGAGLSALWLSSFSVERRRNVRWIGWWLVISVVTSAVAWQIGTLEADEARWREVELPRLTAAPDEVLTTLVDRTRRTLDGADVSEVFQGDPVGLNREDLAFALWRHSGLAIAETLSALVVTAEGRVVSSFSFGLPVDDEGELDRTADRWRAASALFWEDGLDGSEVTLSLYGHPWARVRFWVAVLPGFAGLGEPLDDLAGDLLRGGPRPTRLPQELLPGAALALYSAEGTVIESPWVRTPAVPLGEGPFEIVETPRGRGRAYTWREPRGRAAAFVPLLRPLTTLERVGTQSVGALLTLGLLALLLFAASLPRRDFGWLSRVFRSYPRRLLIVITLLLLLPLLLLNAVLLQTMDRRLEREKRRAGIAALEAAQEILGDYVVTLEPGFVLDTELDDDLMLWLSKIVDHELNLYWGSRVEASSKQELFDAGLLPRRIPGEVFSELSTGGVALASRPRAAGKLSYLELYAPLNIPGTEPLSAGVFLSMPLLAQEEELASEIGALRRRAVVASTALFLVLLAVGGRLASNFAAPITDLVRGTERIAAGESELGIELRDVELSTLARAIDEMAARIARARHQLQREKEVVENMVENITAGIVSLDADGVVLTANRVAKDLLGATVGVDLKTTLAGASRLAELRDFIDGEPAELRRGTLRLAAESEDGEALEWSTVWVPLDPEKEMGALLVVEDVTEVLRGQRLQAWAEMARIIAHEIKNPLTPIRLSTEHLREVFASEPDRLGEIFERCTTNILSQVDELRSISSEFATYSRIPRIEPVDGDLIAAVREIVDGYASSAPSGVEVALVAGVETLWMRFDPKLLGRALRNLLENALRASAPGQRVCVDLAVEGDRVSIRVRDEGSGVEVRHLERIFEPYFSTHETGTGLGLPISRRIAEEHGGSIAARNRRTGGLEVTITLPIRAAQLGSSL